MIPPHRETEAILKVLIFRILVILTFYNVTILVLKYKNWNKIGKLAEKMKRSQDEGHKKEHGNLILIWLFKTKGLTYGVIHYLGKCPEGKSLHTLTLGRGGQTGILS